MKQNVLKLSFLAAALAVVPVKAADAAPAANNLPAVTNPAMLGDLVNEALAKNPKLNFYRAETDRVCRARGGAS